MNAFIVDLENKPGELARVAEAIAGKGINLTTLSAATCGSTGSVALMTNDEAGTRNALRDARCSFREIEAVPVWLEDKPGTLADAARRIGNAGVNIEAVLPTGMSGGKVSVAFLTSDPMKTREAVGIAAAAHA
jgi:hypothetical protein